MPPLSQVYCTDEDIALRAEADYETLCPNSQIAAKGKDGVFDAATPWVLTSATVDFQSLKVHAGQVVRLSQPSTVFNPSQYLAVDGVAPFAIMLRRLGVAPGVGQPPGTGGVVGVYFAVETFDPQIRKATEAANNEFEITTDPRVPEHAPKNVLNPEVLREFCVLHVLERAYGAQVKTRDSGMDFSHRRIADEFADFRQSAVVRWGQAGLAAAPTSMFGRAGR